MGLYAIGDLHLPGGQEKPMDIFGDHWEDHFSRISQDWRTRVKADDTVLIPGDISWAMQLAAARPDLEAIGALPGRKATMTTGGPELPRCGKHCPRECLLCKTMR